MPKESPEEIPGSFFFCVLSRHRLPILVLESCRAVSGLGLVTFDTGYRRGRRLR